VRKISLGLYGFASNLRAVTVLEFVLIAAVMVTLLITAATTLGSTLDIAYTSVGTLITTTAAGM
jgi:Flp pilus assembly pilin Flp